MSKSWTIQHYIRHFFTSKRKGHGVHSPFVYALVENVFNNANDFYAFEKLKTIRRTLLKDNTELAITDFGAGSKKLNASIRKVKDIAQHGISSNQQSEILFKLINYLQCKVIIELGSSIGLNTMYLSGATNTCTVHTIEGSENLFSFSSKLFKQNEQTNIQSYLGNFDDVLPKILSSISSFDLLYIDGNHTLEATLLYFNLALKKRSNQSVIVLDDIYWSEEMTKAWETIKANDNVPLTIDCFYFGLVFFKEEFKQKEHFKLFV